MTGLAGISVQTNLLDDSSLEVFSISFFLGVGGVDTGALGLSTKGVLDLSATGVLDRSITGSLGFSSTAGAVKTGLALSGEAGTSRSMTREFPYKSAKIDCVQTPDSSSSAVATGGLAVGGGSSFFREEKSISESLGGRPTDLLLVVGLRMGLSIVIVGIAGKSSVGATLLLRRYGVVLRLDLLGVAGVLRL